MGRSLPGDQAREIVTGELKYVTDLRFPGMLHGAVTRSAAPHARIVSIDTDEATAMPGVRAVLIGADVPFNLLGPTEADGPVLATDRVRQVGEACKACHTVYKTKS